MDAGLDWGISVVLALQGFGPGLAPLMKALSFLGKVEFYLLVLPAIYWCCDSCLGLRLGLMLMLSSGANDALKIAFHSPRPFWISDAVSALAAEPSFGFPSGHAQQASCVWGLLAGRVRRWWGWATAAAVVSGVGLSRLYLGVHFPVDVWGGWIVGALILLAFVRFDKLVSSWLARRGLAEQVALAFVASMLPLALTALSLASVGSWQLPLSWREAALAASGEAIDPFTPRYAVTAAGVMLGVGAGAALTSHWGGVSPSGSAARRLARYVVGMLGLVVLWLAIEQVMSTRVMTWLAAALQYASGSLLGAWVAVLAPLLFVRLGLAESGHRRQVRL